MRVQLIDPRQTCCRTTTPCRRARRRGAGVELVTSRFVHGPAPLPGRLRGRAVVLPSRHRPRCGALRLRRAQAGRARARHAAPAPPGRDGRPPALAVALARGRDHATAPARPAAGADHAQRDPARSLRAPPRRAHGRRSSTPGTGAELLGGGARVHVIPHGRSSTSPASRRAPAARAGRRPGPVVLCFGVVRPYKGIDVLVEAFRSISGPSCGSSGARSGSPSKRSTPRRTCASCRATWPTPSCPPTSAGPTCSCYRTAPWTCRACCSPAWRSARWCSPTWAASASWWRSTAPAAGPARRSAGARAAIGELLADPAERERLAERARAAAAGPYSWDSSRSARWPSTVEVLAR